MCVWGGGEGDNKPESKLHCSEVSDASFIDFVCNRIVCLISSENESEMLGLIMIETAITLNFQH